MKERIFIAKCPVNIPNALWEDIKRSIERDETWDLKVFEATQRQSPSPIFIISDSLRREILYWKDRRNDCAHSKNETIDFFHVESFWAFLIRNLPKLVVNGSKESLLEKFSDHFDLSKNPRGKDFTHLVQEIQESIDANDLVNFFNKLKVKINAIAFLEHLQIFKKIFEIYDNRVTEQLTHYLKQDFDTLLELLRNSPQLVLRMNLNEEQIRELWYKHLFSSYQNDLPLVCSLLRNNLIDKENFSELFSRITSNCPHKPNDYEYQILNENGFISYFVSETLHKSDLGYYRTANKQRHLIIAYLEHNDLDVEVVKCLCTTFKKSYYPQYLESSLQEFFQDSPVKKAKFAEIANTEAIVIPAPLAFIST